jgi:hypothetical protein
MLGQWFANQLGKLKDWERKGLKGTFLVQHTQMIESVLEENGIVDPTMKQIQAVSPLLWRPTWLRD